MFSARKTQKRLYAISTSRGDSKKYVSYLNLARLIPQAEIAGVVDRGDLVVAGGPIDASDGRLVALELRDALGFRPKGLVVRGVRGVGRGSVGARGVAADGVAERPAERIPDLNEGEV